MKERSIKQFSVKSSLLSVLYSLLLLGIASPFSLYAASGDDYLKAIEGETDKVERRQIDAETQSLSGQTVAPAGDGFSAGMSIDAFEQELTDKYAGTARFYTKLPRRSQEEVYQEYLNGASISEVRTKVMNRFLNR